MCYHLNFRSFLAYLGDLGLRRATEQQEQEQRHSCGAWAWPVVQYPRAGRRLTNPLFLYRVIRGPGKSTLRLPLCAAMVLQRRNNALRLDSRANEKLSVSVSGSILISFWGLFRVLHSCFRRRFGLWLWLVRPFAVRPEMYCRI